jgi:hypothetical protein
MRDGWRGRSNSSEARDLPRSRRTLLATTAKLRDELEMRSSGWEECGEIQDGEIWSSGA